jgi:hypothetical protein
MVIFNLFLTISKKWCYTLILLREGSCGDLECLRLTLDFINHHRARILSTLLSLDHNKSF